ncbi:MAG: protein of unknown function DUF58 [uncultured bacterium (gcode 4)]|uniref:DUF58 domain-containing protein n=1 Tax=uncultured bacterium (gcode 4) TaxID=1234023 RepID=K1XWZ5_9BACT|nr:MAG: protein of unknown function DUF58 [uncultured bacterium (gcode 4)]
MKHPFQLINLVTLKKVSALFAGNYKTSFHGSGIEFAGIREYTFGDSVGDIDWKTTARMGKTYIKTYEEDRERKVLFLLDMGASMRFGSGSVTKFDTLSEIFSILSFSSVGNDDPIGAWFFADQILNTLKIKKWMAHLGVIRQEFETFRAKLDTKESSLSPIITELFKKKIRNHLIFLFSDSLEALPQKEFRTLADQNDLVFIHIFDTFENTLMGSLVHTTDDVYIDGGDMRKRQQYIDERNRLLADFRHDIIRLGGSYLSLDENQNVYKELYKFFKGRQKR